MKKNLKTYGLIILVVFSTLAIIDNLRISDAADKLQVDNEKLVKQVTSIEKELENSSLTSNELLKENKELVMEVAKLEEDVEGLKTSLDYQGFKEATGIVEAYKVANTIKEASNLVSLNIGGGYSTIDREGNCPCHLFFGKYGKSIEWIPNVVLDLKEFSLDKDKVLLTYRTVEAIKGDYQFIVSKSTLNREQEERWMIDEITLIKKE
ncbi:hypothetical protein IMZ08_13575 [Bacillus luteolus]|uniref:Uncharacterized protein n=1 Tax=Litchfieldia luteola TaxID=682179 RepID=A0ABR9QKS3_9BACI|nr:hypothetical protein [Cytobacillus luteolus]MBE4909094.1 hypothetical protein [Cytobacillus luteolus]MBP1940455.1 hypothetical protein [Cytobacillus luteolus]